MLDAAEARAATADILEAHSIPAAVSKNMRDLIAAAEKADPPRELVVLNESSSRTEEAGALA